MPSAENSPRRARRDGRAPGGASPRSGQSGFGPRPVRADRRRRDGDDRPSGARPARPGENRAPRRDFDPDRRPRQSFDDRDDRRSRPAYGDRDDRRSARPNADRDNRRPRPTFGERDNRRPARPYADRDERRPRTTFGDQDDRRTSRPPRDAGARPPRREFDDRRGGPRRSGLPGARPPRREYDSAPRERWSEDRPKQSRLPRDESRPRIQRDDSRPRFDRDDRSRAGRSSYGDRRERPLTPEEQERIDAERIAKSFGWGGVARKGAVHIKSTGGDFQSPREMTPDNRRPDQWIMDDRPSAPAKPKMTSARKPYLLPQDIVTEIRRVFQGSAYQREKMVTFMSNAAEAYDRHRYEEALRLAKTVAEAVPTVAPVLELAGLAAYRAERFPMARKHLRMAFEITGDAQHLPLVMDCERAARRYTLVEGTFTQLIESEPSAEVLTEGRIVMASSLADQSKFQEAIDLLIKSGGSKVLRNPSGRHVRMWYALADVYDRAGDVASARELFARVVAVDPEAYDAIARLGDLGGTGTVRKNRKKRTTPVSKKKNID